MLGHRPGDRSIVAEQQDAGMPRRLIRASQTRALETVGESGDHGAAPVPGVVVASSMFDLETAPSNRKPRPVQREAHNLNELKSELLTTPSRLGQSLGVIWRRTKEIAATISFLRAGIFFVRALRDPRPAGEWLIFLGAFERLRGLEPAPLETFAKPLGNYAVYRLSIGERVAMLRSHYSLIATTLPATALSTIWSDSSIELGYLQGKRGQKYRLTLDPARFCYKEGELSFSLTDAADGLELARLTFLIITLSGGAERALLIGGLQGPTSHAGAGAKTRIVAATRALSGLRPKMAVFAAASAFALATGSKSLRAVSNRTHTINADAGYQRRKMHADYDAFWIERGGTSDELGFKIPLITGPRSQCSRRNEQRAEVAMLVYRLFDLEAPNELLARMA